MHCKTNTLETGCVYVDSGRRTFLLALHSKETVFSSPLERLKAGNDCAHQSFPHTEESPQDLFEQYPGPLRGGDFTLCCLQMLLGLAQCDYDPAILYVCMGATYLCGNAARSHLAVNMPSYMRVCTCAGTHCQERACALTTNDNVPTNRTPEGTVISLHSILRPRCSQ